MKNVMQINYWTIGGFDNAKPVADALREARDMGYEGMELAFGGGVFGPDTDEKTCRGYRDAAEKLGMRIASVASGTYWDLPLSSPDAGVRERAVAFARSHLRAASFVGAETVLVIPGVVAVPWEPSRPVTPYAEACKWASQSVWKLLPTADRYGVDIGLENVWNWFLSDPVAMKTFIDQFNHYRVGSYFDVANCVINGCPEHWIDLLGHRIKAVHFKNYSRNDDCGGGLHGFGEDLLRGDVDWATVVQALERIGYAGPVTAELIPFCRLPDLTLPDLALARDNAPRLARIMGK
ncbi:MAG: sugar phosphate isomerase/epimerase [Planctomycetota bacterium]|jgi:hexulose-6-phosphate isomerase|nr:sugar phosphate isomerase/epimerase [Planctomycetota bacterium]